MEKGNVIKNKTQRNSYKIYNREQLILLINKEIIEINFKMNIPGETMGKSTNRQFTKDTYKDNTQRKTVFSLSSSQSNAN